MKISILSALCLLLFSITAQAETAEIVQQSEGSITFIVDKKLENRSFKRETFNGKEIGKQLFHRSYHDRKSALLATSFSKDKDLLNYDEYAFFSSLVEAYACHHSFTISPDMVWLLITQGFARYVNEHSEEMRDKLVYHQGKKQIVIALNNYAEEILSEDADWNTIIAMYADSIKAQTKGNIAEIITADFSTTGFVEKIASQVTLMETFKSFFEYIGVLVGCGFPTITIEGSPQDWQHMIEKTEQLSQYGLSDWLDQLKPLLKEFVLAAEGKPNRSFWRTIVKKDAIKNFKPGGGYKKAPTHLDGWILKFYPDKDGKLKKSIPYTDNLEKEIVRVPYKLIDPKHHRIYHLELCSGFVSATLDKQNRSVKPKIGWFMVQTKVEESQK